ncbi:FAD-binding oxidoreductase [Pedobacter steynii]|nr:FAD-binding oxidoreductase [Pedobacter steynii]
MNMLKKKALQLIERQLAKSGTVLEVRSWSPSTFYEVDLHLPGVDMSKWTSVQHMKTKVAEYVYRDYTPASWDEETGTCTLYIDAAHDGEGSRWVSSLRKGDQICYLGIAGTNARPVDGKRIVCLGDSSCVGHFLALEQLAGKGNVSGALVIKEESHRREFASYFDTLLEAIPQQLNSNIDNLHNWLKEQQWGSNAVYIAGNVPMVVELKKIIRNLPDFDGAVKVQGFWW